MLCEELYMDYLTLATILEGSSILVPIFTDGEKEPVDNLIPVYYAILFSIYYLINRR